MINNVCVVPLANYPFFLSDFNEILISLKFFEKKSKYQIPLHPPSVSRFAPCGRTDGQL